MKRSLAKILDIVNLICLLGATFELAIRYSGLPAQIITRYALDGSLGAPGKKTTLLVLVLMMWTLTGFLFLADLFPRFFRMRLGILAEETEVSRIVRQMLSCIKLAVTALLWWMLHCALGQQPLGRAYLFFFLLAITLPLVFMIARILRGGQTG